MTKKKLEITVGHLMMEKGKLNSKKLQKRLINLKWIS